MIIQVPLIILTGRYMKNKPAYKKTSARKTGPNPGVATSASTIKGKAATRRSQLNLNESGIKPDASARVKFPTTDTQGRNPDVRLRLLQAALEVFTIKGYSGASVREIVEKAGVTKPALYYYFKSKEGIYLDIIHGALANLESVMGLTLQKKGTARQRLEIFTAALLDLFIDNLTVARLIYSIYYGPPQGAPFVDFEGMHSRIGLQILELLNEGVRSGELVIHDTEAAAWLALGALNFAWEEQLSSKESVIGKGELLRMIAFITNAGAKPPRKR